MATEHRDLRTGRTLWEAVGRPRLKPARLGRDVTCDVVVVGAGITGALTAEALAAAGLKVVIVDRRRAFAGSTAASTALLAPEIDTPLLELSRKIGARRAARAWRRSAAAVDDLAARVRQLGVRCDLRPRSSVYLAGNRMGSRDLQREAEARSRIGLASSYLDRDALERRLGIERRGAILSAGAAEANPMRLTAGFLRQAMRRGARLFAPVEVTQVDAGRRAIEAHTRDGSLLRCRFLVYATGYELAEVIPRGGHRMVSTWAIATRAQPGNLWATGDLIWEASEPYLYARTTVDGRVIAGGEDGDFDDETRRDGLIERKAAKISAKLARLLPGIDASAELSWAGTFGESSTGLPTIGEIPEMRHCYAVLGYGGNGITFSMLAAQILRAAICGEEDPDADLFRFD